MFILMHTKKQISQSMHKRDVMFLKSMYQEDMHRFKKVNWKN